MSHYFYVKAQLREDGVILKSAPKLEEPISETAIVECKYKHFI